jgi:hypothetical protein
MEKKMQMTWSCAIRTTTLIALIFSAGFTFAEELLYDVTFDEPEHTVGNPPTIGFGPAPRKTPTSIGFGQDTLDSDSVYVVDSYLGLERPVEMSAVDPVQDDKKMGGATMNFLLSDPSLPHYQSVRVSFDIVFDTPAPFADDAAAFFDAPTIHRVGFKADGRITAYSPVGQTEVTIGDYSANEILKVEMTFDVTNNFWSVRIQGIQVFQGTAQYAGNLNFRIASTTASPTVVNRFYVDNVRIVGNPNPPAQCVAQYAYHSNWSGPGTPPWNAIDQGKTLAVEGSYPVALTYDNLLNNGGGVTGLVFDILDLASTSLTASDFRFQMSPQGTFEPVANPPGTWPEAPAPSSITVAPGSPARVLVQWPSNAISNRWLRVTLKETLHTGLEAPVTYYIGHLLGETTGPANGVYTVSFSDITEIRNVVGQSVNASSIADIDKNGTVSFADISLMRPNVGNQLSNITIPASSN